MTDGTATAGAGTDSGTDSNTESHNDFGSNDNNPAPQESNPYGEQIASIENRIGQLTSTLDERLPGPKDPDFSEQLYAPYEDGNVEDLSDDEADYYEDDYGDDEQSGAEIVEQMIAERIAPFQEQMEAREEAEAFAQIDQLQERYPDLKTDPAIQQAVVETVQAIVGEDGNPLDPRVVEIAYKAVKADATTAGEVSAETAAQDQAFLETGAGPSQQGNSNPDDDIRQAIRSHSVGGDAF